MRATLTGVILATSILALSACGASSNNAPIVYGTSPTQKVTAEGQIYRTGATRTKSAALTPRASRSTPVELAPMGATYQTASAQGGVIYSEPLAPAALAPQNVSAQYPATTYLAAQSSSNPAYPPAPTYIVQPGTIQPARDDIAPASSGDLPGFVTVQPGDTVYAISRRTGATPNQIIAMNRLEAPFTLKIGSRLRAPGANMKTPVAEQAPLTIVRDAAPRSLTQPARVGSPAPKAMVRDVIYKVQPGDTVYAISRKTDVTVDAIIQANGLKKPYTLSVGQEVRAPSAKVVGAMPQPRRVQRQASVQQPQPAPQPVTRAAANVGDLARNASYTAARIDETEAMFDWPLKGAVIAGYGAGELGRRNDGVNIAAPAGTPVRASADGEVVYKGSELDGYGNLLLIRHDDGFVTAYAHNADVVVKKGEQVRQGQVVAKVGQTGSVGQPQLHFEIRRNLKAVDPLALLQQP